MGTNVTQNGAPAVPAPPPAINTTAPFIPTVHHPKVTIYHPPVNVHQRHHWTPGLPSPVTFGTTTETSFVNNSPPTFNNQRSNNEGNLQLKGCRSKLGTGRGGRRFATNNQRHTNHLPIIPNKIPPMGVVTMSMSSIPQHQQQLPVVKQQTYH